MEIAQKTQRKPNKKVQKSHGQTERTPQKCKMCRKCMENMQNAQRKRRESESNRNKNKQSENTLRERTDIEEKTQRKLADSDPLYVSSVHLLAIPGSSYG